MSAYLTCTSWNGQLHFAIDHVGGKRRESMLGQPATDATPLSEYESGLRIDVLMDLCGKGALESQQRRA